MGTGLLGGHNSSAGKRRSRKTRGGGKLERLVNRVLRIESLEPRRYLTTTPTVYLASTANPATLDQQPTLIGAVPPDATGSVDFKDGQTTLGTAQLADGTTHHAAQHWRRRQ